MAAEAVGVFLERVTLFASDTATMGNSGSVSASRMTFRSYWVAKSVPLEPFLATMTNLGALVTLNLLSISMSSSARKRSN
ncbi:MAG TPA: hypothetical protein VIV15_10525, partial [Anaerolineales bacterium]